jgi:hypothetical protein
VTSWFLLETLLFFSLKEGMPMRADSLLLLDSTSSLADTLKSISNALFQVPVIFTALVLTFVCAIVAWLIAYIFLRPKETCSMVCSIHYLLTIATVVLGLLSAFGLIDHYFPGELITGAGVALLILAIPILILMESFTYIVLGNKHARRHRELRTRRDRQYHRFLIFLFLLGLGAILVVVGLVLKAANVAREAIPQIIILLLVLWILALGSELLILAGAGRRRRRLAALGTGPTLDRNAVAALWVQGFSSYRIGRGESVITETTMTVEEREEVWGQFSERVFITEELFLEEEGRLDLIEVEEAESFNTYQLEEGARPGEQGKVLALHDTHSTMRHEPKNRFFRRWGLILLLLLVAIVAVALTATVATIAAVTLLGIALAFLAPVIFLIVQRIRRDSEIRFATETAEKIRSAPYNPAVFQAAAVAVAVAPAAAPGSRQTTGQIAAVLHPARPVPVNPPLAEPEIPPKEPPEAPTLPSVESSGAAGAAHENPDIADDTLIAGAALAAGVAGAAILAGRGRSTEEQPETAEDALLIGHTPGTDSTDEASATEADYQKYFQGVAYPATRDQLLAAARKNNAPRWLTTWLETVETTVVVTSVSEIVRRHKRSVEEKSQATTTQDTEETTITDVSAAGGAAVEGALATDADFQKYLRGARFPASRDQLLAAARKNNAPRWVTTWLETVTTTVVFTSVVEVTRRHKRHVQAQQQEQTAEAAAISEETPAAAARFRRLGIIEFQRYLRGVDYPATRAQLIAQARANNAPADMLAQLEELDETYTFTSVSEVMRGYAYHRYLRGVTYPATRDQLLAHARANNAPPKLITWLESLETTVVFASLAEVLRRNTKHLEETGEESAEDPTLFAGLPETAEDPEAEQETVTLPAVTPTAAPVSSRINIIEFQRYLHGVDYPVTRAQLIAQARANNAPPNMLARLEELEENHSYINVRDVMIGYAYHRYLRGVTYPATRDQLLAHARANNAPSKLIIWIEALSVTTTFASLTEVVRAYASHQREEVEEELVEEAATAPAPAALAAPAVSSRIGIIEFQRYLHGVDYPVTRAQLIAQAQANNAPPNMIARLQELDENHSFTSVRDVMIGYAYHRYLLGVTYPATRDQLLAHARANKAPKKLIAWLEDLEETATFASLTEVVRRYSTARVEEEEDEEEDEDNEKTITIAPATGEGSKGIGFREFSHFLRGIHYPATRDQLVAQARTNNAPDTMITRLEELPAHHQFKGMADVMRGYGHHLAEDEAGQ